MQNLENLDVIEILVHTKNSKMPEGPFSQIRPQMICKNVKSEAMSMEYV